MSRTREFDEVEALDRAMALFWEQGYEASSVRELTSRTGVSSSSLYAAFGDKHDIYGAALARYRAIEREQFAAQLAASQAIRPTLAAMYAGLIDDLLADEDNRGSFSLNAAIELGGRDPAITAQLREHFDDIAGLLAGRLAAAQEGREISGRHTAADLAQFLLLGVYSLATLVKIDPNRARLERMAKLFLAILDE
jgi:TetR/AcrR family transcriptional repressor of nem operon